MLRVEWSGVEWSGVEGSGVVFTFQLKKIVTEDDNITELFIVS